ncbi:MAG TPA: hypothetical protein VMV89_13745, partial [Candidatus Paceibacterota bacterium]|nr:hypothetical protein [Candidatus Paceibacterota bacterium]
HEFQTRTPCGSSICLTKNAFSKSDRLLELFQSAIGLPLSVLLKIRRRQGQCEHPMQTHSRWVRPDPEIQAVLLVRPFVGRFFMKLLVNSNSPFKSDCGNH